MIAESKMIPTKSTSVMMDPSSPILFLREKRTVARPYPHRAMMFTGYYRPIRRSGNGDHATGLFAQGNAVNGQAYFGDMHAPHLKDGPEPIEESEVSIAHAQAAPTSDEDHHHYHHQNEVHRHEEEQYHEHRHHEEEKHHHQDSSTSQEHHGPEQIPLTTEIAQSEAEEPIATSTEVSIIRPKVHHTKKPPVIDDDKDEDEEDEDDEQPIIPFVPVKGIRRRQGYPHLNNFFPMVFSFPRVATRAGSSDSVPGTITAIANSYSTGKDGVASSMATAYGGSPFGKKRRPQPYEE
ncbi:hypothetical protein CAJAP_11094 [Camponotus japonicus]